MATEFLSPYQAQKFLEGVLPELQPKRTNWAQGFFREVAPVDSTTVNFDKQYGTKNVIGMFVEPKADATPIKLDNFGHVELTFSYAKESIDSDDFDVLNQRQMGQPFGQVDVLANERLRLQRKVALVETRFENLFEYCATSIWMYGGYVAESISHPKTVYNFGRTKATLAAHIVGANAWDLIPSVNLTSSAVTAPWGEVVLPVIATDGGLSFTQGDKLWSTANVDSGKATPVADVTKMIQTCMERGSPAAIHMSDDAYAVFNYDVNKNFKDAASTIINTLQNVQLEVMPVIKVVKGLTFKRFWTLSNGITVPIYTYNGVYNTRDAGTETKYIGSGWVIVIPDSEGIKIHGRIKHPRAQWQAMPRWVNYWENEKTGIREWEYHTSFILGHTNINALVSWKVI